MSSLHECYNVKFLWNCFRETWIVIVKDVGLVSATKPVRGDQCVLHHHRNVILNR